MACRPVSSKNQCNRLCGKSTRLSIMLAMTFGYFLVEIVCGYMTNSMALVADSFHMLSDVLALVIAFCCMKISKQRSKKNTFGWVRAEILGALVNAVFLLALCFSIFVEAIKRLLEPEAIEKPLQILIVGTIGLAINIVGIFMFHGHGGGGHGHSHDGRTSNARPPNEQDRYLLDSFQVVATESHTVTVLNNIGGSESNSDLQNNRNMIGIDDSSDVLNPSTDDIIDESLSLTKYPKANSPAIVAIEDGNDCINNNDQKACETTKHKRKVKGSSSAAQMNMHGVFLHILGDALGSLIVIITASVCVWSDNKALAQYLDPGLSLLMVTIIAATTIPLLKESALILLQTAPKYVDVQSMKRRLLEVEGVLAVHEFHVWRLAGLKIIATAHIRFRNLNDYLSAAEKIKNFFHDSGIHSTTIQPEFDEWGTDDVAGNNVANAVDDLRCYLECPPEQCDVSATCCGGKLKNGGAGTTGGIIDPVSTKSSSSNSGKTTQLTTTIDNGGGSNEVKSDDSGKSPKPLPNV